MNKTKRQLLIFILAFACVAVSAALWSAHAAAADEMKRLASLMQWKPGYVVADIGAGDGRFTFAAVRFLAPSGKIIATEIDATKLAKLQAQIAARRLQNVTAVESKEASTNLPPACCDAIFLRRVYHHLTKPTDFDASIVRSLKPGGQLAIIDFPARQGLEPVEGVPANRGGHGIPEKIVIGELTAAGLQLEKTVDDWPEDSYCVLFIKK